MLRPYAPYITTLALAISIMNIAHMPADLNLASFVLRQAQDERDFKHTL
jgi:hypothetical protein